jgi:choline dehydrogenase-like flavoprotein
VKTGSLPADPPLLSPPRQDKLRQAYPTLKEDLTVDVVVVGAGLEGLCVAYELARAGGRQGGLTAGGGLLSGLQGGRRLPAAGCGSSSARTHPRLPTPTPRPTAGKQVAVLEARTRGAGQSGKTHGLLTTWCNDFYANVEKVH